MGDTRLKGTVINMKSLSQHIENPIIVGGGDSDGRYLTIIFTQEAAARFAPETKVYLSWRHIQKNIKGYTVFTEIPREDTDELTAEEQPPAWYICFPREMLHEGDVLANIELVDDISVAASTSFTIRILKDPWDGTNWIENDDLNEFKTAIIKIDTLARTMEDDHAQIELALRKLYEMFDMIDFVDENANGIPDSEENGDYGPSAILDWTGAGD